MSGSVASALRAPEANVNCTAKAAPIGNHTRRERSDDNKETVERMGERRSSSTNC